MCWFSGLTCGKVCGSRLGSCYLQRELREAQEALAAALRAGTPLDTLVDLTAALDTLSATQHERVNVLLDRGATWSQVADALAISNDGARRRFPRRDSRRPAGSG